MLQAPMFMQIEGVSLFKDDQIWYKFYPIAQYPTIRLDEKGKPVFLLTKYAFSDDQRAENSKLPSGGGYLNFDIQFSVDETVLNEKLRPQLQTWVDKEWSRLKSATPAEQAKVAGMSAPPSVEFGEPTWTDGKVSLDAPQDANLVSARVAEGAPSLLAGNIAVFSMDLTAPGATFMEKVLVNPDGSGGTDLSMLQVIYNLKFWSRLPPVHIHIKADSEKLHDHVQKIIEGRGWHDCTYYDFDHTDIDTETASLTGMIDIQIDTGSAALDNSELASLRTYALDLVKEMIQANFFSDKPDESDRSPTNRNPNALPANGNPNRFFKQTYDKSTMKIELDLEQSSVVEWKINPQATLQTFFKGMKPQEIKQFVRKVDLNDDFFSHLGLTVCAYSDYKDPVLSVVEVDVHYNGTDESGKRQDESKTFTFTSQDNQLWNPSLIGSKRDYEWRYRVGYKDHGFGEYTEWKPDLKDKVSVNAAIGRIKLVARAGYIDFVDFVEQVQVQIAYEAPDLNVPREVTTIVLNANKTEVPYERLIYQEWKRPLEYKTRFILKNGETIEDTTWRKSDDRNQILINQPKDGVLQARFIPVGDGWDDVSQVVVDLRYDDLSNQYNVVDTLTLKTREDMRTWKVVLQDQSKRDFDYQVSVSYKSGRFDQTEWKRSQGQDAVRTVPIEVKGRPTIKVTIDPTLLNFANTPVVEATLDYNAAGISKRETFVFRDKVPQLWKIDVPEGAPVEYNWQVTYYPIDSDPLVKKGQERDTSCVIPTPPKAGKLRVELASQLVDFNKTPMVQVDLQYDDEANGTHEIGSLSFTQKEKQAWELNVKDVSRKLFGYKLTYFFADDTPAKTTEMKFQEASFIPIPKV